jgi:hypothetical protein
MSTDSNVKLLIYKKMKKIFLVFTVTFLISKLSFSQDIITLKTGEQIRSKIMEVGQSEIKYKKYDNQNGPVYVVTKSDLSDILYENGTKDIFNNETSKAIKAETNPETENTVNPKGTGASPVKNKGSRFLIGFSGVYPTGTWPATALSNMGSTSFLKGQGNTVTSYGFGIVIQGKLTDHFNLFFDINAYDYNILLGSKGQEITTAWTTSEAALNNASQLYVQLPDKIHFDMQTTGFRLGGKYIVGNSKIRPWVGAAFGFYRWNANYFNDDKSQSYGKDSGYVTGLTFLCGVDFELMPGILITPFADLTSPAVTYKMNDLFYKQWDIEYDSPIMGAYRIGLSLTFDPHPSAKK